MKARSKNPIARRARAAGAAAVIAAGACAAQPPDTEELDASPGARPQIYDVEIVRDYPHDTTAFTQGLFFADGALYESTGHYGKSEVRRVNLRTGRVIKNARLPDHVFGEGSTRVGDRLISLTWRSGVGHIHDLETLSLEGTFEFAGEGWGLTFDGERLILSDGTPQLRFLDPDDFRTLATLDVTYLGQPISNLNELEWIDGEIWANVWRQDVIIRIDPGTGAGNGNRRFIIPVPADPSRGPGGRRTERHRLRTRERPIVRHRKTMAKNIRVAPSRARRPGFDGLTYDDAK